MDCFELDADLVEGMTNNQLINLAKNNTKLIKQLMDVNKDKILEDKFMIDCLEMGIMDLVNYAVYKGYELGPNTIIHIGKHNSKYNFDLEKILISNGICHSKDDFSKLTKSRSTSKSNSDQDTIGSLQDRGVSGERSHGSNSDSYSNISKSATLSRSSNPSSINGMSGSSGTYSISSCRSGSISSESNLMTVRREQSAPVSLDEDLVSGITSVDLLYYARNNVEIAKNVISINTKHAENDELMLKCVDEGIHYLLDLCIEKNYRMGPNTLCYIIEKKYASIKIIHSLLCGGNYDFSEELYWPVLECVVKYGDDGTLKKMLEEHHHYLNKTYDDSLQYMLDAAKAGASIKGRAKAVNIMRYHCDWTYTAPKQATEIIDNYFKKKKCPTNDEIEKERKRNNIANDKSTRRVKYNGLITDHDEIMLYFDEDNYKEDWRWIEEWANKEPIIKVMKRAGRSSSKKNEKLKIEKIKKKHLSPIKERYTN
jgi:hypothetical protein